MLDCKINCAKLYDYKQNNALRKINLLTYKIVNEYICKQEFSKTKQTMEQREDTFKI